MISLELPSAPPDKTWLEGRRTDSAIVQGYRQYSGSYFLVEAANESATFTIQSLGGSPGPTYLACPATGNTPILVKEANDPNYVTKWITFQGNGDHAVRLGCIDASGKLRLLNGGGGIFTSLSDASTGADAGTNWRIQHQAFEEDPNLLKPGAIVSFNSLTKKTRPWIAAYPGKPQEAGVEQDKASPATYFQVEKRYDGRGVSLKSLNKGTGHFYLECNFALDGLQLAPNPSSASDGTAFKAYKLTNAPNNTLFRLACSTPDMDSPLVVAPEDTGPPNLTPSSAQLTTDSILYLETRDGPPKF